MQVRFVSPWYPQRAVPQSGIFVAKQAEALQAAGTDVVVDVPLIYPAPVGPIPGAVQSAMRALAQSSPAAMFASTNGVTYVPTPVPARGGPMGRATAMAASLSLLREVAADSSDLVHAHLGVPSGWAVSRSMPTAPLVVTEHQSTLAAIFTDPAAAAAYAEVVRRANAFICVSEHLRDQIVRGVGEWAHDSVEVVPNVIDVDHIPYRQRIDSTFSSWVYIGGLTINKGTKTLMRTFDRYKKRHDPEAKLTLIGAGPLRDWVARYVSANRLADSVKVVGSVEHDRIGQFLDAADVMVQLSTSETFGIAPLEGIAAGLPVIALRHQGTLETWGDMEDFVGLILPLDASPQMIAREISTLRDSSNRLDGARARQLVARRFSGTSVASRLVDIYQRVVR